LIASICTSKCLPWNTAMSPANALRKRPLPIRDRTVQARQCQQERFRNDGKVNCNARMGTRQLKQYCKLDQDSQDLIRVAMSELNLSARAYDRILKVSRTIADLDQKAEIAPDHVSEAIQYRTFDRTLWV
jgi:magnesium chelatase family protein